jgi:DNA polymerase III alpha subunit
MPCAWRRVETKQGGLMLFLTLADRSGVAECVLFPDAYRAHLAAVGGQVVRAEGRVDEALGAITLTTDRLVALDAAHPGRAFDATRGHGDFED